MKLSVIAITTMLAVQGQACVRVLIEERWDSAHYVEKTVTLWDRNDETRKSVKGVMLNYDDKTSAPGEHYAGFGDAAGYEVSMGSGPAREDDPPRILYSNGYSNPLFRVAGPAKYPPTDGRERTMSCWWDAQFCGADPCGLP